jgi:hypothetical protein
MEIKRRLLGVALGAMIALPVYPYGRGLIGFWAAIGAMALLAFVVRMVLQQYDKRVAQRT